MRTKSLKIFEFFIYQSIYSAKTNSRAYILLLLTPTRTIEILYGEVPKKKLKILSCKQKQAMAVIMISKALNTNNKMNVFKLNI